jgi:translation initiation factor IF-3
VQQDAYRVNRRIRVPEVRVIGADGAQLGVLATHEALRIAEEGGLDLVEVSPKAMPPVCKIMDYGKFKYEDAKKKKDARKHQSFQTVKEIKFRPKTDDHDFDFKVKHIRRFLGEGNKAKLVVIFRGREIVHPETGQAVLRRVVEVTSDVAVVEQAPMMEGRRMLMVIAPRVGVVRPAAPRPTQTTVSATPATGTPASATPAAAAPRPQSAAPAAPASPPRPAGPTVTHKSSPTVQAKTPQK